MQYLGLRKQHASPLMSQSFKPGAWLTNIDFIKRLIAMNHLLIVVMSEAQGGKSTFVDLMRFKFEPAIQTVLLEAEKEESESLLLESLSTLFNVSFETNDATFESFFESLPVSKHPILLVIDNAQHLNYECLNQLTTAYKEHGAAKRVYLCLVSDFSLSPQLRRLEQASFKHFIHTIEPGALTESEAKTYVLRYAQGQKGLPVLLTPDRFKAFYAATQGQIAAIHRQLKILTEIQFPEKKRTHLLWKLAPSLVLSVAVFVGIAVNLKSTPLVSNVASIPPITPIETVASYVAPWYAGVEIQPVQPPPFAEDLAQDDSEQLDEKLALIDKVVVIPDLTIKKHVEKKQIKTQHASFAHNHKNVSKPSYTIQLLAAKDKHEINDFVKQYHLSRNSVQIRQVWRGHEKWFVLTMGGYPQVVEAQSAAQRLPVQLKQLKPWVRLEAQLEAVG